MFTGIVTDIGRIEAAEQRGDLRLRIATRFDMATVDLGASIACSGVCLTVVGKGEGWFAVDLSNPTNATLADTFAIVTITDDDAPPSLRVGDLSCAEGDVGTTACDFPISLSAASGRS